MEKVTRFRKAIQGGKQVGLGAEGYTIFDCTSDSHVCLFAYRPIMWLALTNEFK